MSLGKFDIRKERIKLGYPDVPVPRNRDWDALPASYRPEEFTEAKLLARLRRKRQAPDQLDYDTLTFSSYEGKVRRDAHGRPLNPLGATGITGLGILWHPGPSKTADAAVTRPGVKGPEGLFIFRTDNGRMALPGGFLDEVRPGKYEDPVVAAERELKEETGLRVKLRGRNSTLLFRGASNAARNTDNAWIETSVYWRHLDTKEAHQLPEPKGSDDARQAFWAPLKEADLDRMNDSHADYVIELRTRLGI